jgi:pilus assembly protein Flp/PilA
MIAPIRRIWAPLVLTKEWAMRGLTRLLRCERGANAIEYALVASLIAIAAVAAMQGLAGKIETMFNNVSNQLPSN